ncbi:MAG: serine hydrolase, partial [Sphingopyxis sp.]|nr:serine hydrolase [Sphingopyxis sp.]
ARSVRGETGSIIGKDAAAELMTRGPGNWGLGVDLGPADGARQISHTGKNVGFTSMFIIYPDSCQGAVVMTNGYDGGWLTNEVMRAIGDVYRWPPASKLPTRAALPVSGQIAERFVGTYRLRDFPAERFSITRGSDGELIWAREGHVGRSLLPEAEGKLFSPDSVMTIEALSPSEPRASAVKLSFGGGSNIAERTD